jgi:hypothetical protein
MFLVELIFGEFRDTCLESDHNYLLPGPYILIINHYLPMYFGCIPLLKLKQHRYISK